MRKRTIAAIAVLAFLLSACATLKAPEAKTELGEGHKKLELRPDKITSGSDAVEAPFKAVETAMAIPTHIMLLAGPFFWINLLAGEMPEVPRMGVPGLFELAPEKTKTEKKE